MLRGEEARGEQAKTTAISVIMPVYKERPEILRRTVNSILGQTFRDFELLMVIDNPENHEAIALAEELRQGDARIRCLVNARNLGVWPSYNRGIRHASGRYLAIQDADDVSQPHRLEVLSTFLEQHPEVDVVGAALRYVDERTGQVLMTRYYPPTVDPAIRRFCPLAHATTLRRAGLHERYGYYDESPAVKHAADYELWCRWRLKGVQFRNVPEMLYDYQQSAVNFKSQNVRAILRDTVHIKWHYAQRLGFGLGDYLYLGLETLVGYFPRWAIIWLFYRYSRVRSAFRPTETDLQKETTQ